MDGQTRKIELEEKLRQLKKEEHELSTKLSINKKDQTVATKEIWHIETGINIGDKVSFKEIEYGGIKYTGVLSRLDTDRTNTIFPVVAIAKRDGTAGNREKTVELTEQKTLKKL